MKRVERFALVMWLGLAIMIAGRILITEFIKSDDAGWNDVRRDYWKSEDRRK